MKKIRITIALDVTQSQADRLYPMVQEEILKLVPMIKSGPDKRVEHARIRVVGFSGTPLMLDIKTDDFLDLKREQRKARRGLRVAS